MKRFGSLKIEQFVGIVYSGDVFLGTVQADSMVALKRKASLKCNGYFNVFDTMIVHRANNKEIDGLKFTRVNRKCPNNTIIRGKWN